MDTRLIEIFAPAGEAHNVRSIVEKHRCLGVWEQVLEGGGITFHVFLKLEDSESFLDDLQGMLAGVEGFRVVILPVEASLPRIEEEKEESPEAQEKGKKKRRISREELYQDLSKTADISWVFIILMIISTVVAAVGFSKNSAAIVIGAMVIAPLLGPNMAMSLSTTLGDVKLASRAASGILLGVAVAVILSIVMGFFLEVDPTIPELASRINVNLGDILIALASGAAGALSFTVGVGAALVGVMVAVALIPPLVGFGMLLANGYFDEALASLLLFLVNVICVNLSAVLVFLAQGIRPRTWWEAEKAKRATRIAVSLWIVLLLVLIAAIILSQR